MRDYAADAVGIFCPAIAVANGAGKLAAFWIESTPEKNANDQALAQDQAIGSKATTELKAAWVKLNADYDQLTDNLKAIK